MGELCGPWLPLELLAVIKTVRGFQRRECRIFNPEQNEVNVAQRQQYFEARDGKVVEKLMYLAALDDATSQVRSKIYTLMLRTCRSEQAPWAGQDACLTAILLADDHPPAESDRHLATGKNMTSYRKPRNPIPKILVNGPCDWYSTVVARAADHRQHVVVHALSNSARHFNLTMW